MSHSSAIALDKPTMLSPLHHTIHHAGGDTRCFGNVTAEGVTILGNGFRNGAEGFVFGIVHRLLCIVVCTDFAFQFLHCLILFSPFGEFGSP
jgi:hypothetical protein